MDIPPINISVTKAAVDGRVVDVIDYDEYCKNKAQYLQRYDVAIPIEYKDKELLLPLRGTLNGDPITPGVYNDGCVDFIKYPDEEFTDRYIPKATISMSNKENIKDLILAGEALKRLDEPFITTPDCVTNIPIRETDQPEMVGLKLALNAKHIDIDTYAGRFGDNYPNDKRQLKSTSATMKIIKRFCNNCDMEAVITFKDKGPDVPNPMNREISISLTEPLDDDTMNMITNPIINDDLSDDESDE